MIKDKEKFCKYDYRRLKDENSMKWIFHERNCDSSMEADDILGSKGHIHGKTNQECKLYFNKAKDSQEDIWMCTLESCKKPIDGGCADSHGSGIRSNATFDVQVISY